MPNGGQIGSGSGLRLQSSTPGAVDTGNANLSGKLIVGALATENAPSLGVPGSNLIVGRNYIDGVDAAQQLTVFGNNCSNGAAGDYSPQFSTIIGFGSSVFCQNGIAIGYSATAGVSRGNVAQSNSHLAIGSSTGARGEAADFANFGNTAVGSACGVMARRGYVFGNNNVATGGTGQSDLILIGSNISVTGNNLVNCIVIRSAAAGKNLTAAVDSNSIIIGEPSQTRVVIGPYTITNGIAAVGALQIGNVTIANTAAETTAIGALVGSNLIPAGRLTAGSTIRIRARGIMVDTGAPTLRIRVKVGANTYCDTGAVALAAIAGTHGWIFEADVTVRTPGSPGTAIGNANFQVSVAFPPDLDTTNTATTAIDTAIANTVDLTFQWGTADPANTITVTHYTMEILG